MHLGSVNGSREDVFLLVDVLEEEPLSRTVLVHAPMLTEMETTLEGPGSLTKRTVTIPPRIVGPPKSQMRCGSTTTDEHARLTMYAMAVLKRLMADTRPLIFTGAREYAMP
jgi:hypothetical protein